MGKSKKKQVYYVWTEKAKKLFGEKVHAGDPAVFMGERVSDRNILASWVRNGYVVREEEVNG